MRLALPGHLDKLTEEHTAAKISEIYGPFRPIIVDTLDWIRHSLLNHPNPQIHVRIHKAWRSDKEQLEAVRAGTSMLTPDKAPHCRRKPDGTPAACAADFWLLDDSGVLLPDRHPAWAIVPAAAWMAAGEKVVVGAHWNKPRDWPHVEMWDWRKLVEQKILI